MRDGTGTMRNSPCKQERFVSDPPNRGDPHPIVLDLREESVHQAEGDADHALRLLAKMLVAAARNRALTGPLSPTGGLKKPLDVSAQQSDELDLNSHREPQNG